MNASFYSAALCISLLVPQYLHGEPGKTAINDQAAAARLQGEHYLSLQWLSSDNWNYFGHVSVTTNQGVWRNIGRQDAAHSGDYITVDGVVTEIDSKDFKFNGTIVSKVSNINNGRPTTRSGAMTFRITGGSQYWRLKEMQNPADDVVDYIDIYFKRYQKRSIAQKSDATSDSHPNRSKVNETPSSVGRRSIDSFRFIGPDTTMKQVFAAVGHEDRDIGSGISIYEYRLSDDSFVWIGSTSQSHIIYVRHGKNLDDSEILYPKP
jgi:hypothetical protein